LQFDTRFSNQARNIAKHSRCVSFNCYWFAKLKLFRLINPILSFTIYLHITD